MALLVHGAVALWQACSLTASSSSSSSAHGCIRLAVVDISVLLAAVLRWHWLSCA
jgi:hypothetical protein